MIVIESIESIGLMSIWMLDTLLPELLLELKKREYATARVKPKSLGGYDITFIEPNVVAIKGPIRILYDFIRHSITIEGLDKNDVLSAFNEIEEILRSIGNDPAKGVLFYELQAKAKASGSKWSLKRTIKINDPLELELLTIPISFVSAKWDPNSTQWFHFDVRPLWTSWSNEKVRYEVILTYRDNREKLINVLRNIDNVFKDILEKVSNALEIHT